MIEVKWHHLKIDGSLKLITKKNFVLDTQKVKRKESKYSTTKNKNYRITKKNSKKEEWEKTTASQKIIKKVEKVRPYLSLITLNKWIKLTSQKAKSA